MVFGWIPPLTSPTKCEFVCGILCEVLIIINKYNTNYLTCQWLSPMVHNVYRHEDGVLQMESKAIHMWTKHICITSYKIKTTRNTLGATLPPWTFVPIYSPFFLWVGVRISSVFQLSNFIPYKLCRKLEWFKGSCKGKDLVASLFICFHSFNTVAKGACLQQLLHSDTHLRVEAWEQWRGSV